MTTTIKISAIAMKTLMLSLIMSLALSASNGQNNTATVQTAATTKKKVKSITISGTVKKFTRGKDGYMADVQTDNKGVYNALVSSINVSDANYQSCNEGDKVTFKGVPSGSGNAKRLMVTEIISVNATDTQLWITEIGFRGIQVGDVISMHDAYTKKIKLKTGESSFDVYEIKDFENNPAGYFLPDPKDKLLVGDITVNSPKAQTAKGIKIGDTFQDLLKNFPDITVHGSEIEGRTYASTGAISYRLDVPNFNYAVDKAKIPAATKITQIIIERGVAESTDTQTPNLADLATKYEAMKDSYVSYQTSKVLDLHTKPASDSKVEGKHFAGHGQPENGTNVGPVNLSERVLRETHFVPFEAAIKEANLFSIMPAYHEIDGVPVHVNK